jgi:hypothetical protein
LQAGGLVRVDPVVLGLGAVDEPHVQSVAEDEGELLVAAAVGQPVPAEHALAAQDDLVAERLQRPQEQSGLGRQGGVEPGPARRRGLDATLHKKRAKGRQ